MFDIGWSELVVIAVVALIAIGPKELPGVLRMVGQWMGKARKMAAEFQGQFQEAMREAEMADLKKSFDEVKQAASGFTTGEIMTPLEKDVSNALRVEGSPKPVTETAGIEPPSATSAPEASIPQILTEPDPRYSEQPLAITRDIEAHPAPHDLQAPNPEMAKDAKAS